MRVILKPTSYSFNLKVVGKKVIATKTAFGGVNVSIAELNRVGAGISLLDTGCPCPFSTFTASDVLYFKESEFDVVELQFINCTDNSTCREGWEEYYERKGSV